MSANDEVREILVRYFEAKIQKYDRVARQDDVENLSWSEVKQRTLDWAYKAGTNEKVAGVGAVFGGVAGGAVGGLIGLPILGVGEVATAPLGAVVGAVVGTGAAMGVAAGVGASSAIVYSAAQRGYQKYQQNNIDRARNLNSQLSANLGDIVNNLLNNQKLFNVLSELNSRGKESRIKAICKDYYKIVKRQAQNGELNVERALCKLENKSSVKGSALSRFGLFTGSNERPSNQQNEEVYDVENAVALARAN